MDTSDNDITMPIHPPSPKMHAETNNRINCNELNELTPSELHRSNMDVDYGRISAIFNEKQGYRNDHGG